MKLIYNTLIVIGLVWSVYELATTEAHAAPCGVPDPEPVVVVVSGGIK